MGKLSIEEKAKAYDKALERAQALYNDKNEIGYANAESVLEEVFPLLKESEDEKTERILHSISSKISFHLRDIFTEEEFQCFDTWSNAWLEKQGKGKLTDKPKFKVSDWCIDNEDGTIFQIMKVFNDTYNYKTNEGKKYCCSHYSLENDARLWTIADAKDGDVLTNGDFPCIFKRCDGNGSLYVYCGINAHNDFSILSEDSENIWDDYSKQYFPATKEQRDLLFQKMHEAGYEWDADEKELKKIEQKSQRMVSAEAKEAMYDKPACAWSEKDENVLEDIKEAIINYWGGDTQDILLDWLKSLKERYTWKPSIAQLNALSIVSKGNAPDDMEAIVSLYNDLKKLREE